MKKLMMLSALATCVGLTGCGQLDSAVDKFKSSTGMLHRTITVYAADGSVIKKYETDNQVEYAGSVAMFVDTNGLNVRVSGTFIIEGK